MNTPYLYKTEDETFSIALDVAAVYTFVTLIGCTFFYASYGKLSDEKISKLDISVDPRLGWFLMELPATVSFLITLYMNSNSEKLQFHQKFLCFMFLKHYLNRGFYFPLTLRVQQNKKATFSLSVILAGVIFTSLHGYLNATYFTKIFPFNANFFYTPTFLVGYFLYEASFWGTIYHEDIIKKLRKNSFSGYKIPFGGLFNYITNATYFCELLGWFSWTLMTWNPAGLFVFCVSCINLIPRAFKQHEWYKQKFPKYPRKRKILIPFII
eukprot:snap_masked-scaffold_14-processed-gene-6.42-mRNA-1 protein AED:0.36 eAED:0.36 QI:0/-1/0/1/-1/1/1/0/267